LTRRLRAIALVAAGSVVFSFDALLIKLQTLSPPGIVFWRGAFSACGFLALALIVYRGEAGKAFLSLRTGGALIVLFAVLGTVGFVVSLTYTTVAQALLIIAASPIITAVLSTFLLRERLARRTWVAGAVVFAGVAGIVWSSLGSPALVGDIAAFFTAMSLAFVLIVLRAFRVKQFAAMALGGVATAALALPFVGSFAVDPHTLAIAFINAALVIPVALLLITHGPQDVLASEASLLLQLETVLAPLWVWSVIGQTPSWQTLASGAVILGALVTHSVLQIRQEYKSAS
jgi:drug/metabolite transporter (DMT)-like permease